jgi:hypothetical protein
MDWLGKAILVLGILIVVTGVYKAKSCYDSRPLPPVGAADLPGLYKAISERDDLRISAADGRATIEHFGLREAWSGTVMLTEDGDFLFNGRCTVGCADESACHTGFLGWFGPTHACRATIGDVRCRARKTAPNTENRDAPLSYEMQCQSEIWATGACDCHESDRLIYRGGQKAGWTRELTHQFAKR